MTNRNPAALNRINLDAPSFTNSMGKNIDANKALRGKATGFEGFDAPEEDSLSIADTQAHFEKLERDFQKRKEDRLVDWDAALAELQLADTEDLTSSAWRAFKYRVQQPISMGPNLPEITGEEFNKANPPMEKYGEEKIDPNKTLNEVQQMMIREHREYRRGLLERAGKGKDTVAQGAVNLVAQFIGGATVGDVALALAAPQIEAGVAGARLAPTFMRTAAKALQNIRKTKGLKGSVFINLIEHALSEIVSIPTENKAREDVGVKEYSKSEIALRILMGMVLNMGITTLSNVVQNSKYWRGLFEKDPEKAAKKFNEQVKLLKDGVPFNENTLLDSWDAMTPEDKLKFINENTTIDETRPTKTSFDNSEDVLKKYVDELLEVEHQEKLAAFEKKGDTEGAEAPKKETYKEVSAKHENAGNQIKSRISDLVECLKG